MNALLPIFLYIIIFVTLWFFIQKFIYKGKKQLYDERQLAYRGEAYRAGFYTLILALTINSVLEASLEFTWGTRFAETMVLICISLFVFISFCIFKDSYYDSDHTPLQAIIIFTIIGGINIYSGVKQLYDKWASGTMGKFDNTNLTIGILLLSITIMLIVRWIMLNRQDGDE